MKPTTPKWILENHSAIYTEYDSDIEELTIELREEKLPQVTNIRFGGGGSFSMTHLVWDKLLGAKSYTVSLLDPHGQVLHTEDVSWSSINLKENYFNKFIASIKEAGEHSFSIIAKPDRDTFYIYKGRVVQFTQESNAQFFVFNVEIPQKLETPINLQIGGRYVGSVVYWEKSKYAGAYYVTVEDSNGNIIYEKCCDKYFENNYYYLIDENFYKYINKTGDYTMKIYALGSAIIEYQNIIKRLESDPLIAILHYDVTTKKLTIKSSTFIQEKFVYQNLSERLFLGQQAIEYYSLRKFLL